jgi:hypothetical protein
MPRAGTPESEDVVVVKKPRAPRTRAVSAEGEEKPAPRKRAPRKTAPKAEPVAEEVVDEPVVTPGRKAPTAIAANRKRRSRSNVVYSVIATFCLLLIGAGVAVGLFDHGQIDVVTVVTQRNEKIARGEVRDENGQLITTAVPTQVDNRPNGGLTMAAPTPVATTTPVVETPVATTTATSTDATATSTASTTKPTTATTSRPAL